MSIESVLGNITNLIPVVLTTGVAWKMTESMMSDSGQQLVRRTKKRKKRNVYSREWSGNFGNVGF